MIEFVDFLFLHFFTILLLFINFFLHCFLTSTNSVFTNTMNNRILLFDNQSFMCKIEHLVVKFLLLMSCQTIHGSSLGNNRTSLSENALSLTTGVDKNGDFWVVFKS